MRDPRRGCVSAARARAAPLRARRDVAICAAVAGCFACGPPAASYFEAYPRCEGAPNDPIAVLVVMDLQSRRVQVAGIVREPYEDWMLQVLRNLIDSVDGFLLFHGYLIMDRDPVFTQKFRARLARAGSKRFNRSIQEECLNRVVPLGEAHLRQLVRE